MPKTLWPHPDDSSYNWTGQTSVVNGEGRFLNDDGVEDMNGLWQWENNRKTWYRRRAIHNARAMQYFWANRDAYLVRMRLYDINFQRKNEHRRESRGLRYCNDAAIQEIIDQESVREITMSGDAVFPDENEFLNVDRRDEVLPSLVRFFGGPNLPSDIDPDHKHSIALEALTDAHDNDIPLAVCDSKYDNRKDVPRKEQTTEFALGWFGWDGQMLDYLSWKNEDGSYLSNEQWDEIHEAIGTKCIGMPICGWGSPELRIFAEAGRDDGIDAMQAILTRFPQLRNAKTKGVKIDGTTRNITKHFSMAMDCFTSIFGMRSRAYHNAIDDIMGEAVAITAYVRFISQFDDLYAEEKLEA